MKRFLPLFLLLLLLVGCSKSVDETTLIEKDGLMYLPDSDKAYTGEVFTNYDTGEKDYQGKYENGLLVDYSFLNKDGSVKEPINEYSLQNRLGIKYQVNSKEPFSGSTFFTYKNGQIAFKGEYRNGLKDGRFEDYYANGQLKKLINYDNDVIKGNIFDFTLDGESITHEINGLSDYSINLLKNRFSDFTYEIFIDVYYSDDLPILYENNRQ